MHTHNTTRSTIAQHMDKHKEWCKLLAGNTQSPKQHNTQHATQQPAINARRTSRNKQHATASSQRYTQVVIAIFRTAHPIFTTVMTQPTLYVDVDKLKDHCSTQYENYGECVKKYPDQPRMCSVSVQQLQDCAEH